MTCRFGASARAWCARGAASSAPMRDRIGATGRRMKKSRMRQQPSRFTVAGATVNKRLSADQRRTLRLLDEAELSWTAPQQLAELHGDCATERLSRQSYAVGVSVHAGIGFVTEIIEQIFDATGNLIGERIGDPPADRSAGEDGAL
jgi:hypothetical protein